MGWLWSSTASGDNASSTPISTAESAPSSPTPPDPSTLTRDEIAERELQSFLDELEADAKPSSTRYSRISRSTTSPHLESTSSSSKEPLSEQLLPRHMSCRTAFDAAFYCNSLGGQFNNLYRYGTVRSCSENWNDFWFCMRTRTFSANEKEEAIRERYREKERMRYERREGEDLTAPKSSEDVWRSRDRKLEWGKAFCEPFEEFEGSDEEWNLVQQKRRNGTVES